MATRTLLKLKPNLNLPLRFLHNPASILTRPLAPITRSEGPALFKASTFLLPGMCARQMGTNRSPRGVSRRDDDDEAEEDMDDDEDEFDLDDEFEDFDSDDLDDDEEEEEPEEKPRGKKTYGKKG